MAAEKQFENRGQLRAYMEQSDIDAFREAVKKKTGRTSGMSDVIRDFCLKYIRDTKRR